eukprot:TRINITY_DN19110_c0_g1_i2.p1 TRINITY_DN19110_c0_g1~~TRINITY_DN19110_c0_g1_i2.p1  ORF type:complete len:1034 (+),score=227.29 TRINITY_DN19110_c0_g1_i2:371-3103(+)
MEVLESNPRTWMFCKLALCTAFVPQFVHFRGGRLLSDTNEEVRCPSSSCNHDYQRDSCGDWLVFSDATKLSHVNLGGSTVVSAPFVLLASRSLTRSPGADGNGQVDFGTWRGTVAGGERSLQELQRTRASLQRGLEARIATQSASVLGPSVLDAVCKTLNDEQLVLQAVTGTRRLRAGAKELRTLYVGGIPSDAREEEIRDHFSKCGLIEEVSIPVDPETARQKGFGFVVMASQEEASEAAQLLEGSAIRGKCLRIDRKARAGVARPPATSSHRQWVQKPSDQERQALMEASFAVSKDRREQSQRSLNTSVARQLQARQACTAPERDGAAGAFESGDPGWVMDPFGLGDMDTRILAEKDAEEDSRRHFLHGASTQKQKVPSACGLEALERASRRRQEDADDELRRKRALNRQRREAREQLKSTAAADDYCDRVESPFDVDGSPQRENGAAASKDTVATATHEASSSGTLLPNTSTGLLAVLPRMQDADQEQLQQLKSEVMGDSAAAAAAFRRWSVLLIENVRLELRKRRAVTMEDYAEAARIKRLSAELAARITSARDEATLCTSGGMRQKIEDQKRLAVAREDYEEAARLKKCLEETEGSQQDANSELHNRFALLGALVLAKEVGAVEDGPSIVAELRQANLGRAAPSREQKEQQHWQQHQPQAPQTEKHHLLQKSSTFRTSGVPAPPQPPAESATHAAVRAAVQEDLRRQAEEMRERLNKDRTQREAERLMTALRKEAESSSSPVLADSEFQPKPPQHIEQAARAEQAQQSRSKQCKQEELQHKPPDKQFQRQHELPQHRDKTRQAEQQRKREDVDKRLRDERERKRRKRQEATDSDASSPLPGVKTAQFLAMSKEELWQKAWDETWLQADLLGESSDKEAVFAKARKTWKSWVTAQAELSACTGFVR